MTEVIKSFDKVELGEIIRQNRRIRVYKVVDGETFIYLFELLRVEKNKLLSLVSLVIKTKK